MSDWAEVADRVYVLRYPGLDVNATLVAGDGAAVLVDTFATARQAGDLREAVRHVTAAPPTLVNTHHHFDHTFGNATLRSGEPVWAHSRCVEILRDHADAVRRAAAAEFPDLAVELADTDVAVPDREVHGHADLLIGGRTVLLRYLGRAHTDNDLAVLVPDAGVTITGDLVEAGAPPAFEDSWPLEWAATVADLLIAAKRDGCDTVFVPGHGAPVDASFVQSQHAQLAELEWLCRQSHADSAPVAEAARRSPFGADASTVAVRRAYATLDGRL